MRLSTKLLRATFAATLLLASGALYAHDQPSAPTISLSAEASVEAPNDLGIARLYFEDMDADAAALAKHVNEVIADALETARGEADVKTRSAGTSTYPVHDDEGRQIEKWRMRSTIELESLDSAALARLVGKLQETLVVSDLTMQPSPATRDKAADSAAKKAIEAFQGRAGALAKTLGKNYRIRDLNVQYPGMSPVRPVMYRMAADAAQKSAPAPIEPGQSEVSVSVSGTIELVQ